MEKKPTSLRLDEETCAKLDAIAGTMERDRAYVLKEAIKDYIALHEWQVAHIQKGLEQAKKGQFADSQDVEKAFSQLLA